MNIESLYERSFGRFPLQNITISLLVGQVIVFIAAYASPGLIETLTLRGQSVLGGEVWRVATFLFLPVSMAPVWVVLSWYFLYIIGSGLEAVWGAFRYTAYIAVAWAATCIASLLFPAEPFGNGFIFGSVFLAFARLNPDFTLLLFFIIPVKIKWLAYLTWASFLLTLLTAGIGTKVQTLLAVSNYVLFFGEDMFHALSDGLRRSRRRIVGPRSGAAAYMRCTVCGKTEHDGKIFYWCHDCLPERCFCDDHFASHTHTVIH